MEWLLTIPWNGCLASVECAIKSTLPEGSVVYPAERNSRGQYLLMLDEGTANGLSVQRRLGER